MGIVRINLSVTTVVREGKINMDNNNRLYGCNDIEACYNVECEDCIFDKEKISLSELKKIIIND